MNLELDHIFILVKPEAKVADLLLSIGMVESFSRAISRSFTVINEYIGIERVEQRIQNIKNTYKASQFASKLAGLVSLAFALGVKDQS